jgi:flagellar motor switch protein FliN
MTDEASAQTNPAAPSDRDIAYARLWAQSLGQVLGQISGSTLTVECQTESPADAPARSEHDLQFVIVAEGGLRGEMTLRIPAAVALALAQVFLGETQNAKAEFKPDHREAVEELLRQVAGYVVTALKPRWGEVSLRSQLAATQDWPPGASGWMGSVGDTAVRISIDWQLDARLRDALALPTSQEDGSSATSQPATDSSPQSSTASAETLKSDGSPSGKIIERNLDLLLDVELEVMLRFGERSMLLREILELGEGSVVELDRAVDEPVDLLLDGQIIARGEVVVVDGNYGLRVLEVQAKPSEA